MANNSGVAFSLLFSIYAMKAEDIFRCSIGCEIMLMIKARVRLIYSSNTYSSNANDLFSIYKGWPSSIHTQETGMNVAIERGLTLCSHPQATGQYVVIHRPLVSM